MMNRFWSLACVYSALSAVPAFSEPIAIFQAAGQAASSPAWLTPGAGSIARVELDALRAHLEKAPILTPNDSLATIGLAVQLPGPDGQMVSCVAAASPVMEPDLQAKFPEMRTYVVRSIDGTASGRFELTQRGLTGMLRTPHGAWMIDAVTPGDTKSVVSYWLRDLSVGNDWACHTIEGAHGFATVVEDHPSTRPDRGPGTTQVLRTVRIAIACSGEYGLHQCTVLGHAANPADPLAAIVTVVSRTNVVYEADLGVHFNLVANNNLIIYTDPLTDPYPDTCDGTGGADCSSTYLGSNITNLSNVLGNSTFDVGHILTRVYGGVAYLSSVCTSNKAGGVSGIPRGGDVDPLSALVVIHELGHQFGASHTFSGSRGRCNGNVSLASAWEAGSGSSPMAYPGGCPVGDAPPSDNVAIFAEPYFHHGSLAQMKTFLNGATCPVQSATTNRPPVIVSSTGDFAIPPGTPFVLSAVATDADNDPLTYSWEQFDSGVARPLSGTGSEDNGSGALFRAFSPVLSSQRTFPRLSDIRSGIPTPGEQLPTFTGVIRRFRVVVRDNHAVAGSTTTSGFTNLTIATGTTPFAVTSPALMAVLNGGANSVTWSVGGTSTGQISATTVTIRFSNDDGLTFPTSLGSFPNNGSASVNLPGNVTMARVKIEADGRPFFAMSGRFSVNRCPSDFDASGTVTVQDIFSFLMAWFQQLPSADLNNSGSVGTQDIFTFLSLWFAGC